MMGQQHQLGGSAVRTEAFDRAELAAEVGQVYVVSKTSPSIVKAAEADPEKFWVAKSGGLLATEEALYALGDKLGAFIMG